MAERVTIYGKESCPYTTAARQAYRQKGMEVDYVDVKRDGSLLEQMLKLSGGQRKVPVIVAPDGKVTVGFGGT